ncbi:conserved hypothetical protein [Vibrio chagasii]|nr:conserved hypothetical protein [Vibrio chagasii]CAH7315630.1 conserved hypothetical protein [Vibrio chagasii]
MSNLFKEKLENLHSALMSAHKDTIGYTSPVLGAEREIVNKQLLSHILPPSYRVGSGAIIDEDNRNTGHVDAIIEQPFSLSFPVASEANRLYVAGAVGAAFEIKSDLYNQKKEALDKVKEIKKIQRHAVSGSEFVMNDTLRIPTFIVSFKGYSKMSSLTDHFIKPTDFSYPDGVFIIESELFYGRSAAGNWYEGKGKSQSMLAFISCVTESLKVSNQQQFSLSNYSSLLY